MAAEPPPVILSLLSVILSEAKNLNDRAPATKKGENVAEMTKMIAPATKTGEIVAEVVVEVGGLTKNHYISGDNNTNLGIVV